MLQSPDARERRDAAAELRDEGPPPDAVRPLLEAAKRETDPKTYGEMIITLGASGAPEAESIICEAVWDSRANVRRWASKAFLLWIPQNRGSKGCPPPTDGAPAAPPAAAPAAPAAPTVTPAAPPPSPKTI
jgi:hypothetical protein